jgi:hypothetical protein
MHFTLGPAVNFILEAFVATNEGKFIMFKIGVSTNYKIAKGPSRERSGSFGNAIVPGKNPLTLILLQSKFLK